MVNWLKNAWSGAICAAQASFTTCMIRSTLSPLSLPPAVSNFVCNTCAYCPVAYATQITFIQTLRQYRQINPLLSHLKHPRMKDKQQPGYFWIPYTLFLFVASSFGFEPRFYFGACKLLIREIQFSCCSVFCFFMFLVHMPVGCASCRM